MGASVQQLVATLYESLSEPGREQSFVEQYAERVGATTGAIIVLTDFASDRNQVLACTRVDPAYRKAYEEYYGSVNVYVQRLKQMRTDAIVQPGEAICPDDELVRTEYYNDYMRPQRVHHSLGMAMHLGGGLHVHLGATRPKSDGAFGNDETAVAEAIAAHLGPVFQVRERFLRAQQRAATLSRLTDALPFGVLLLNGRGKIMEANHRAAEILRARDGLSSNQGELAAAFPGEASALRQLVARALATSQGRALDPGDALRISRTSWRRAYNVLVSPFRAGISPNPDQDGFPAALVIVGDPEQEPGCEISGFCRLYGLTPAEGRVCSLLLNGRSPKEIAAELRITMNTARTHIKRILSKTETTRQAELVRLALSSTPVRSLTRGPNDCGGNAQ